MHVVFDTGGDTSESPEWKFFVRNFNSLYMYESELESGVNA